MWERVALGVAEGECVERVGGGDERVRVGEGVRVTDGVGEPRGVLVAAALGVPGLGRAVASPRPGTAKACGGSFAASVSALLTPSHDNATAPPVTAAQASTLSNLAVRIPHHPAVYTSGWRNGVR